MKCSELGTRALIRNTLTIKKKGAKRPRKIKILGRFAPGTERWNIKCIDSEKKMKKKIFSKMLWYEMSKNRSELGTPSLFSLFLNATSPLLFPLIGRSVTFSLFSLLGATYAVHCWSESRYCMYWWCIVNTVLTQYSYLKTIDSDHR